ncbi:hypothetical protein FHG87_001814 [Trinorchestia longiramus]|nr:hypothetical protein FHG87_001814 [Trinorchestia longiramus]
MTSVPAKLPHTKTNTERLLKHVKSWYDQNGLQLNASKTVNHLWFEEHNKKASKFNFNVMKEGALSRRLTLQYCGDAVRGCISISSYTLSVFIDTKGNPVSTMKHLSFAALLLLVLMDHQVFSVPENHPEPLSIFKEDNTFYKVYKPINDRLVPAFELSDYGVLDEISNREETHQNLDDLYVNEINTGATQSEQDINNLENASVSIDDSKHESNLMSHIPSTMEMIYSWKTLLADFINTVHKVTRIYQDKREELLPEMNKTNARSAQSASLPSVLLDLVLSPRSLDELIEVGRSVQSEDEVLRGLTSVMLRSEKRSGGSSLTLDPVTVIALLTLAAYLIRAVYQILITNNNGRSFDFQHPSVLGTFTLPENVAAIMDAITGSHYDDMSVSGRLARAADDEIRDNSLDGGSGSGVLSLPGSVAAITKLRREGHSDCINLYTCEQLAHKNIFSYSLEDVLVVSMGAYLGDVELWQLLNPGAKQDKHDNVDRCGQYRGLCQQTTLREARQLRDLFTKASSKLLRLLSSARDARRRSYARSSSDRYEART